MKTLLTQYRTFAAVVLAGCAACTFAQSLGEASAELWIGQPLEVTIPTRFNSADDRDTCVHAEVSYGATRLAPERVRTTVLGTDEHRRVRVSSDLIVDEPTVTVALRAGCGSSVTRSYTLLPDMPSEAVLARLMQGAPAVAQAAPRTPALAAMVPVRADRAPMRLRLMHTVARVPAPPRMRVAPAFRAAPLPAAVPRLRLEAIEADAHALLRVSADLSQPGDAARRAQAALLWQALNADPQDRVRSTAALQRMEYELAQLQQTAGSTRAEMANLRRRLDEARPWYLQPRLLEGLVVLATAAAAVLLAWRSRRGAAALPWYTPGESVPLEPQFAQPPAVPLREAPAAQGLQPRAATPVAGQAPIARAAPLVPAPPVAPLEFTLDPPPAEPAQLAASSGLLRVETLAAVFEEAEFLASLGLPFDAMDVLKAYLADSASPAPVAWFQLMHLCELAGDPQAQEAVRRRYHTVFGVPAPTLSQVSAAGGLERHAALADRIVRAWGTPQALPVIEHALFDPPAPGAPLTLEAARDLVSLYDVAMLLVTDVSTGLRADSEQPLAPWAHAEHLDEAQAYAQAVAEDMGGHRFALDIDLTVTPQKLPEKPPEPSPQEIAARLRAAQEAARQAAERAAAEAEEAFNAAVASERAPISRY